MERESSTSTTDSVPIETPLIQATQIPKSEQLANGIDGDDDDTQLDKSLRRLDFFLGIFGFRQTSILSFVRSWLAFSVVGIVIPVTLLELNNCTSCEDYQIREFEFDCLASQACLGAASLLCLAHNLRKYGIRKFLFVDQYSGHMSRFMDQYIQRIRKFYAMLILWLLPCLVLKAVREIVRVVYAEDEPWWRSGAIVLALVISWTYINTISLAACVLFHLVCSLQVIHFEDYCKSLETESDIPILIDEHIRLRHYLTKISHKFRIYLLLVLLVVTASQLVTLLQITRYNGSITFLNGGDFAVTSVVQVVGIILCLHGATKISHKAQNVGAVASKWHALITSRSSQLPPYSRRANITNNVEASNHRISTLLNGSMNILEACNHLSSHHIHSNTTSSPDGGGPIFPLSNSESNLEALDSFWATNNIDLVDLVSSYHKRESFVMYLQSNPGGITIYGWTVDRTLICTIFFIELSLVLFLLGNTMVL